MTSRAWEQVWEKLSLVFDWLKGQVAEVNPGASSRSERVKSTSFPFGASLAFNREGKHWIDDLVVSIETWQEGATLQLSCYISTEEGYVLADGPEATVDDDSDSDTLTESVRQWLAGVEDFLRSNKDMICQNLRRVES